MFLAIVPAYNEEARIGSVVRNLFGHVDGVVVIDDASSDGTFVAARDAGAIVLRHKINRGQGAALETGHAYARQRGATHVVHFDGDGQFDPLDIQKAKQALEDSGKDMLFGSRYLDGRSDIPFFKRVCIHPAARLINTLFTGMSLSDAHNGFRVLGPTALEKIRLTQDRMAHATEIMGLTKTHGLTYIEFPVKVTYHEFGQRASAGFRIIKDLILGKFVK